MLWTAATALVSHWRRRPLQFFTLILGLSLATALWSGVQAINAEARASYARAASVLEQNELTQLVPRNGNSVPLSTYSKLRRAGWNVSPIIEGDHRFGNVRVRLIGSDPLTMPAQGRGLNTAEWNGLAALTGTLVVSKATALRLQGHTQMQLEVSPDLPDGAAFTDIAVAEQLLDRHGEVSRLVVSPEQRANLTSLDILAPEVAIKPPGDRPDVAQLTDSFHLNLTAFGFLAFAVGLFIVYATIGLAFEQRRATFRTLRSLGLSLSSLNILLMTELLTLAFFSGLVGVVIGYFVASLLLPDVAATLKGLYGASVPATLTIRPEWWATGLGIAVGGTIVSSAQSLWRVRCMPLLAAAQPRAWARATAIGIRLQFLGGLALLIASVTLANVGHGLVAGFAVLACLLLGAALMLPGMLSACLAVMQRNSSRVLVTWFWADTRQQLPGLSLALMALLLALAANVGVGTMVSSFRLTFIGWLDQRLAAELYVTAREENEAMRLRTWLLDHSTSVLPIWSIEGEVLGDRLQIFGAAAGDPTYRDNWPLLSGTTNVWDQVAAGQGALINEQFWRRKGLEIGDRLVLPGNWTVPVVGVYSDYGNPKGQVIVGVEALTAHYADVPKLRYGVRVRPVEAAALKERLTTEFGLPSENVIDQASLKQQSQAVFDQTFAVTGMLNLFTLGVAGFAMFSSLLTLSGIRLPQLAPVWAMGIRRRDLGLLEVLRTLALWLATFVAAVPVGLALSWVLLSIVNVEAFGWRLPLQIFPMDWLVLGLVALAAAILSVFIPLRRLATVAPSDLLRVFANER
ncbi:putative ABC transport system permease protein [Rhizobium azibense]|uniref:Putative ABC transport system permease protein n=1 Tax=Rhizobium azibense TaxID=1136135 RepID=A0A4R3R416_9HYPH|nr:ABC transporter permease [Rhizobium azibense]TCU29391.1 putative ABC transport system permease protein [Rhizobium azibense]TCU38033.1 putative ABC transport system permease protein [Rhizobium azibense]